MIHAYAKLGEFCQVPELSFLSRSQRQKIHEEILNFAPILFRIVLQNILKTTHQIKLGRSRVNGWMLGPGNDFSRQKQFHLSLSPPPTIKVVWEISLGS